LNNNNLFLYRSGSTGKSKASAHFHHTLAYIQEENRLNYNLTTKDVLCTTEIEVLGAFGTHALFTSLYCGCIVTTTDYCNDDDWSAKRIGDMITRAQITQFFFTASWIKKLCVACEEDTKLIQQLATLKEIIYGGEALPKSTLEELKKLLPNVRIGNVIGASEFLILITGPTARADKDGSLGLPSPLVTVRLVDDQFNEVPVGVPGVITFKGPKGFNYAGHAREKMKDAIHDGWNVTKDIAMKDEDGYYWFKGRTEDLIIIEGENFSKTQFEEMYLEVLYDHIAEIVVFAIPDEEIDTMMLIAVAVPRNTSVLDSKEETDKFIKHMQELIQKNIAIEFYRPRRWAVFASLPKTRTRKFNRLLISEIALKQLNLVNNKQ